MFDRPRATIIASLLLLAACGAPSGTSYVAESAIQEMPFVPPLLPYDGGEGDLVAWGGADALRWRPEATLANAASSALNAAWKLPDVQDVIVAMPLKMWSSELYPYGDGQSNAAPSFEQFPTEGRPPLIATLIVTATGSSRVTLRFHRSVGDTSTIELLTMGPSGMSTVNLAARRDDRGDIIADWTPPTTFPVVSGAAFAVHPAGWQDWFPISFEHHAVKASSLDAATKTFADGRGLLDREGIFDPHAADSAAVRLAGHTFTATYNGASNGHPVPFTSADVHGRFPYYHKPIVTAVGSSSVWLADERPSGYKSLYACFSGRRAGEEASAPNGGVASGAGWHRIGDPIETLVNDLETQPVLVGFAKGNPLATAELPSGGFAWGLGDVATVRWLRPKEAFVTPRGSAAQPTYHWFAIHQKTDTCLELLTHPE